jgi:spore cortex formation protein SpoVR/YcgB (stage V sporulation)
MRKLRLFKLENHAGVDHYKIAAIHEERGYTEVRRALAAQYDPGTHDPNIQVTGANLAGDRKLTLTHRLHKDVPLAEQDAKQVLGYIADLWGFEVELRGVGADDKVRYCYDAGAERKPAPPPIDPALAAYLF